VEDRLVQRSVARILEAIYEADFLDCSYGFRPGRNPHKALATLRMHIVKSPTGHVFETDIKGFFNHLDHQWLLRMLAERIGDPVILRLIRKWLKAGVLVDGSLLSSQEGSPQGGPISPILANIYLHYALDLWFERRFRKNCSGQAYLVRFADDFVACFEWRNDAMNFATSVAARVANFGLELAPEKTQLLTFGRWARRQLNGAKPGTFTFLGFRHICGTSQGGSFALIRLPAGKSCRRFLDSTHDWLAQNLHRRPWEQQSQLRRMLTGFYQYFGLYHCTATLSRIRNEVLLQWRRALLRRSQRHRLDWQYLSTQAWFKLPSPLVLHPTV
jgi:group II intron reverse transcriptase/maturase